MDNMANSKSDDGTVEFLIKVGIVLGAAWLGKKFLEELKKEEK